MKVDYSNSSPRVLLCMENYQRRPPPGGEFDYDLNELSPRDPRQLLSVALFVAQVDPLISSVFRVLNCFSRLFIPDCWLVCTFMLRFKHRSNSCT